MTIPATFPRASSAATAAAFLLFSACGGSGTDKADSAPTAAPPPTAPAPAAAPAGSSTVAGTIVFEGKAPRLKPIGMDADPDCASKHDGPVSAQALVLGDGQTLGNVFVQVMNPPEGTYSPPAAAAVIDQRGCLYNPRVLGVVAGQTVRFRNSDGILHNVHGLPKENREFNLGMPPAVTETDTTFSRPEPVFPVKCDVHPWMRTFVAVMSHPFFAVTGESGEFSVEGLPAGTYEIAAWHEKLGIQNASVTVGDGETATADFSFSVPSN